MARAGRRRADVGTVTGHRRGRGTVGRMDALKHALRALLRVLGALGLLLPHRGRSRWSLASDRSVASVGSSLSVASAGSWLSIASVGSICSIGSTGSILSIGSAGSILSIGASGSILSIGGARPIQPPAAVPTATADTERDA
jgi:hypothetical protein